jgi:hypothetical protein
LENEISMTSQEHSPVRIAKSSRRRRPPSEND